MPSFSSILYALRASQRAQVHGQTVRFKKVMEALSWGSAAAPSPPGMGSGGVPAPNKTPAHTEGLCPH